VPDVLGVHVGVLVEHDTRVEQELGVEEALHLVRIRIRVRVRVRVRVGVGDGVGVGVGVAVGVGG